MKLTPFRAAHWLRTSLWFVPLLCVGAGMLLSFVTVAIDRAQGGKLIPRSLTGGPEAALEILGTVASSMVNLTALVLTVTMVVVQLAMAQFSPRIVATILRDKPGQLAIGTFVAAFVHAILSMSQVRNEEGDEFVPGLAIVVAFVLVLVSISVLVWYVNHTGLSLRVASLIEAVGVQAREKIDQLHPDPLEKQADAPAGLVVAPLSGVLFHVDHPRLVELARRADVTLEIVPVLGDFVPAGAPLIRLRGRAPAELAGEALRRITLGKERSFDQDLAYALRLMVDIAVRSLGDPFDPTTAVQALDRIHDCLRQLVGRHIGGGDYFDAEGKLRLVLQCWTWEGYVQLAFEEIRAAAHRSIQVTRRLRACLEDLIALAGDDRRAPLVAQLRLLDARIEELGSSGGASWQKADPQGIAAADRKADIPVRLRQ